MEMHFKNKYDKFIGFQLEENLLSSGKYLISLINSLIYLQPGKVHCIPKMG